MQTIEVQKLIFYLLNGLGELESIQKILVEHAQDAIDSLHS